MNSLTTMLQSGPYLSYAYSYPHKMAYRPLPTPVPLQEAWAEERRDSLFLYLHIPFCEMRCGFCNLFTTANPARDLPDAYLDALERQAERVKTALGSATFSRMAVGGGTPTYLEVTGLSRLFQIVRSIFGVDAAAIPISVETSPQTSDQERFQMLRANGVDRISIGVQSFVESEVAAAGRSQKTAIVEAALLRIRDAGFPILNIDLIYGLPGQTLHSWGISLDRALQFSPEELYLYPLYVRPLTGIHRVERSPDDLRLACYRSARDHLLEAGYQQISMRMFRKACTGNQSSNENQSSVDMSGPIYCCQEDGMVGLGSGARSYTRGLHYSTEYAVGARGVREILNDYISLQEADFNAVDYGFRLNVEEQQRRYIIKSLLQASGLSLGAYATYFGASALEDYPQLTQLFDLGLASVNDDHLQLTPGGLEQSDVIGPWLYSKRVQALIAEFDLK